MISLCRKPGIHKELIFLSCTLGFQNTDALFSFPVKVLMSSNEVAKESHEQNYYECICFFRHRRWDYFMSPAPGKNKIVSKSWLVLNQLKQKRTKRWQLFSGQSSGSFICRGTKMEKIQALLSDTHTRWEASMSAAVQRDWNYPIADIIPFIIFQ